MTAPNHIQIQPSTTHTSSISLPDIPVPPGSFITLIADVINVSGTTPSLTLSIRARTKDGSLITMLNATPVTAAASRTIQIENSPDIVLVRIQITGTSPSFDIETDLIITPPASSAV